MDDLLERWQLTLGEEYASGAAGRAFRVELPEGTPAVLKLQHPHREAEQEADALERWDGAGAVRLLARDDERHALLLERCEPGTSLSGWDGDRLGVLVELLPRLWKGAEGFHTLADEVAHWGLEGEVGNLGRDLAGSQGELVLVHQDLLGDSSASTVSGRAAGRSCRPWHGTKATRGIRRSSSG